MIDKLKDMLVIQAELNKKIFAEHGTSYDEILKNDGFFYAILDELGEWNHERKSEWCWWKKTQNPANRDKELEELVDVLHFALSHDLALNHGNPERVIDFWLSMDKPVTYSEVDVQPFYKTITDMTAVIGRWEIVDDVLEIAKSAGFTFDDLYNAYMAKNKVNHERLANGY